MAIDDSEQELKYPSGVMDKQVKSSWMIILNMRILLKWPGISTTSNLKTHSIVKVFSRLMKVVFFQVLTSTKALDDTKRYAVGILSDQELHMTPVVNKCFLDSF
jgi:hypothetical protein